MKLMELLHLHKPTHVINYGTPTDIETYYQEIGRAGRDGIMSKATLYYQDSDFSKAKFLINIKSKIRITGEISIPPRLGKKFLIGLKSGSVIL